MRIINRKPGRGERALLGAMPFVGLALAYALGSHLRRLDNPSDKLLPSLEALGQAFWRMAFEADQRSGDYLLWTDTAASLFRLGTGLAVSLSIALVVGIAVGVLPRARAGLDPFVAAVSLVPPITVLTARDGGAPPRRRVPCPSSLPARRRAPNSPTDPPANTT